MDERDKLIRDLVTIMKLMLRRLKAREKYAAGYRVGKVSEKTFSELEKTEGVEEQTEALIERGKDYV